MGLGLDLCYGRYYQSKAYLNSKDETNNVELNSVSFILLQRIDVMDRPRRTTRQPVKSYKLLVASDPAPRAARRKVDPEQRLNTLLESSKSELATIELPVRI